MNGSRTEVIHTRCISILANLWHAPDQAHAIGTATTGSSEAIQLGGLAMKRIWQEKRKAAGKSIHDPGPNIVMGTYFYLYFAGFSDGAFVQEPMHKWHLKSLCFDVLPVTIQTIDFRFARYFEVECRLVPVTAESRYRLDPKHAMEYVDENTIGS